MELLRMARLRAAVRANAAWDAIDLLKPAPELLNREFPCSDHTALSLAASEGHLDTAVRLLEFGAAPQPAANRPAISPLHEAARHGYTAVVMVLLEAGADPALRDVRDLTALDLAAAHNHQDTLRTLVIHVPPSERRRLDGACAMALFEAARKGCQDTARYLERFGVPVNAFAALEMGGLERMTRACYDEREFLCARIPAGRSRFTEGAQPLHHAVLEHGPDAIRQLLRLGADPQSKTTTGLTALALSAAIAGWKGRGLGYEREVAHAIVVRGESGSALSLSKCWDRAAKRAPNESEIQDDPNTTTLLLECDARIDAPLAVALGDMGLLSDRCKALTDPEEGIAALCLACWLGRSGAVDLLLRHGVPAAAELPGCPDTTALRMAVQGPKKFRGPRVHRGASGREVQRDETEPFVVEPDRPGIAVALLYQGARDDRGEALTAAVKAGNRAALGAMLRHPNYPVGDARDPHGEAIAAAILLRDWEALSLLLERGVDANRPVTHLGGMRPLHVVLASPGPEAGEYVSLLLAHGADPKATDEVYGADAMEWACFGSWPGEVSRELERRLLDGRLWDL